MVCVYCSNKTKVINSRSQKRANQVWRRRLCNRCQAVFTTNEMVDFGSTVAIKGKNGHLQPFMRDKLFLSIHSACNHRNDAAKAANALTATAISKLLPQVMGATLAREHIITGVTEVLRHYDNAAAVQYQAYHPL